MFLPKIFRGSREVELFLLPVEGQSSYELQSRCKPSQLKEEGELCEQGKLKIFSCEGQNKDKTTKRNE